MRFIASKHRKQIDIHTLLLSYAFVSVPMIEFYQIKKDLLALHNIYFIYQTICQPVKLTPHVFPEKKQIN